MPNHFSHVIKVDDEVYAKLQEMKSEAADTPNRVLRRVLHLPGRFDHDDAVRSRRLLLSWRGRAR